MTPIKNEHTFSDIPKMSLNISDVKNSREIESGENSFVELSSRSVNSVEKKEWWIQDLNLTLSLKEILVKKVNG